jgi:tetratricopeptide (TPR) repeat protein
MPLRAMFIPASSYRIRFLCAAASLLLCACLLCRAQQTAKVDDARVEELYAAAKAAQSRGDIAGAITNYETLIRVAPRLAPAYNNLGMLYLNQQDYPKAAEVLKKGLAIDPHMPSASALLGIALFKSSNFSESRAALESALKVNPEDDNATLFLAKDLIYLKDMDGASAHLRILAQREPHNQEVWYLLGQTYMQLSEQALARMNAIDPNSPLVHEVSGEMMEDMKNYQGAVVEYKKAVAMAPEQAGTHYRLGNIYWKLSQWDDALGELRAELKNDPNNYRAWAQIGNILITQQSQPESGLEDVNKALQLCPDLAQAHVDRGNALVKLGRNQEAVTELETAERDSPDDPMPHFLMAHAQKALGDTSRANAEMQTYARLQAQASEAVAARAAEVESATKNPH